MKPLALDTFPGFYERDTLDTRPVQMRRVALGGHQVSGLVFRREKTLHS